MSNFVPWRIFLDLLTNFLHTGPSPFIQLCCCLLMPVFSEHSTSPCSKDTIAKALLLFVYNSSNKNWVAIHQVPVHQITIRQSCCCLTWKMILIDLVGCCLLLIEHRSQDHNQSSPSLNPERCHTWPRLPGSTSVYSSVMSWGLDYEVLRQVERAG